MCKMQVSVVVAGKSEETRYESVVVLPANSRSRKRTNLQIFWIGVTNRGHSWDHAPASPNGFRERVGLAREIYLVACLIPWGESDGGSQSKATCGVTPPTTRTTTEPRDFSTLGHSYISLLSITQRISPCNTINSSR